MTCSETTDREHHLPKQILVELYSWLSLEMLGLAEARRIGVALRIHFAENEEVSDGRTECLSTEQLT